MSKAESEIEEVAADYEEMKTTSAHYNGTQRTDFRELMMSIREKSKSSEELFKVLAGNHTEERKDAFPSKDFNEHDRAEVDTIIDSFQQALTRKAEDRVKEKENLKAFEAEQKLMEPISPSNSILEKKNQCIKILGKETFHKVYNYLKKAKMEGIPFDIMKQKMDSMINKDKPKMNAIFTVDQIVEIECIQSYPFA